MCASFASLSAQSEIALITTHLSSALYSLATERIAKASISTISAAYSSSNSRTFSGLSMN
jgi:hypothetical protein